MSALSELDDQIAAFASEKLQLVEFETWFFDFYQQTVDSRDEGILAAANKVAGLLGEATHAEWSDADIREELTAAIRTFRRTQKPFSIERPSVKASPSSRSSLSANRPHLLLARVS